MSKRYKKEGEVNSADKRITKRALVSNLKLLNEQRCILREKIIRKLDLKGGKPDKFLGWKHVRQIPDDVLDKVDFHILAQYVELIGKITLAQTRISRELGCFSKEAQAQIEESNKPDKFTIKEMLQNLDSEIRESAAEEIEEEIQREKQEMLKQFSYRVEEEDQ